MRVLAADQRGSNVLSINEVIESRESQVEIMELKVRPIRAVEPMRTLEVQVPESLVYLAEMFETSPREIINHFVKNLLQSKDSDGVDQRLMAKSYFLRTHWGEVPVDPEDYFDELRARN